MASIVRLALLIEFHIKGTANVTENLLLPWFSTVVEIGVAIIGSCLPCLLPLYRRLRYGSPDSRPIRGYGYGSKGSRGAPPAKGPHSKLAGNRNRAFSSADDGGPFEMLTTVHTTTSREDSFAPSAAHKYHANASVGNIIWTEDIGSENDIPLEGISVQHEVTVKRSRSRGTWLDDSRT